MRAVASLAWLLGLGLVVLLVAHHGAGALADALALAGAGLLLAPLAWLPSLLIDTLGWNCLLAGAWMRPRYVRLLLFRWIGIATRR